MGNPTNAITRRSFLAGTLALGATASGAIGTSVAQADVPDTWDYEADVVVCGFGSAGFGAAVAANEAGRSVIVLEKEDEANAGGGLSCCTGNILSCTPEGLRHSSYNHFTEDFSEALAARTIEACDWFYSMHPGLNDLGSEDSRLYTCDGNGYEIYTTIEPKVAALDGIQVEFGLSATGIVQDPTTGEAFGVRATRDGKDIFVKGKLATVVATGGIASEPDLMRAAGYPAQAYCVSGSPAATGDGMKMLLSAGAKLGDFAMTAKLYTPALRAASDALGSSVQLRADGANGCIYVNTDGKRFCCETSAMFMDPSAPLVAHDFSKGYKNLPAWAVWDSEMMAGDPIVEQSKLSWARSHMGLEWGADNLAHGEDDGIVAADTLEELSAKMTSTTIWGEPVTVDAGGLQATVEAYNSYVDAGTDIEFGRDSSSMPAKLTTPPFYAAEILPNVLFVIGGVDTNEQSQVLDVSGQPIPRLFAAGDVGQGQALTTLGISGCFSRGRIAGEQATQLEAWDN